MTAPSSYDAVVIGAGHNGLACAAYLARAGVSTLLVEARDTVGGCASTVDALGARVNICNCDHFMVRATPLAEELDLAAHGLEYLDLDPAYLAVTWDGDPSWTMHHSVDATLESIAAAYPNEVEAYRRYLDAALPAARLVLSMSSGLPTPGRVFRRLATTGGRGAATLLSWSRRSALEILRRYFTAEPMITPALTMGPIVWGVAPDAPGTGLAALGYALRHLCPVGRPVGGSGALTDALRSAFEQHGGETRCGATVVGLETNDNRVTGVRMGDDVVRSDVVIGACDPATVMGEAEPGPDGYESKIDAVIAELPQYRSVRAGIDTGTPTAVITPTLDEMLAAVPARSAGRVIDRPMMLANTPSVIDPGLSPAAGGHVLSLEVLWTPYALAEGWERSSEPQRWLDRYATLVQPGFLEGVQAWRVMTPPRYEAEFGMRRGYTPSYPGSPVDAVLGRPPALARYRTDVEGLYLSGAATYPGAGIWGASGRNAAAAVLADLHGKRSPTALALR